MSNRYFYLLLKILDFASFDNISLLIYLNNIILVWSGKIIFKKDKKIIKNNVPPLKNIVIWKTLIYNLDREW
jgi:hypothetical protein